MRCRTLSKVEFYFCTGLLGKWLLHETRLLLAKESIISFLQHTYMLQTYLFVLGGKKNVVTLAF